MTHEFARGFFGFGLFVFRQNRHERLRKRTFGKHAPQQVGQLERHEKRVRRHACAERAGDNRVADKAENARHHGQAADFGQST